MGASIDVSAELLAGFLDEAAQYMEQLNTDLLKFEGDAEAGPIDLDTPERKECMNEMFRAAHSLKGVAATLGFEGIEEVTHLMETLFDRIRMGVQRLDTGKCETLFSVIDCLQRLIDELTESSSQAVDIQSALDSLNRELAVMEDATGASAAQPQISTQQRAAGVLYAVDDNSSVANPAAVATPPASELDGSTSHVLADPELRKLFFDTTMESIDGLNESLLKLEQHDANQEILQEIFRMAHNIKGACGAAGLHDAYEFTHHLESVLDKLRHAVIGIDDELISSLFRAADALRETVEAVRSEHRSDMDPTLRDTLFSPWLDRGKSAADDASKDGDVGPATELHGVQEGVRVEVEFPPAFGEAEIQAFLILNKLRELGNVVGCEPDVEHSDGTGDLSHIEYLLVSDVPAEDLQVIVEKYGVQMVRVRPIGGSQTAEVPPVAAEPPVIASLPVVAAPLAPVQAPPGIATLKPTAPPQPVIRSPARPALVGRPPPAAGVRTGSVSAAAVVEPAKDARAQPAAAAANPTMRSGETVRVDIARLDQLMNLGGELVICRARLNQIQSSFVDVFEGRNLKPVSDEIATCLQHLRERLAEASSSGSGAKVAELSQLVAHITGHFSNFQTLARNVQTARGAYTDFAEAVHVLGRVSDGLQKGIMDTRMVPVGPLFTRFNRVVRDLCRTKQKKISLELVGENTELDKRMIDELGDPLTHMVRNAVDHGLETPEERLAAGKPETGQLTLEAYHSGNSICIRLRDDGRGVDHEAVRRKAVEREIMTPQQAEQASSRELVQLIFDPGFSTAKEVSDLSGRGMGMDIVMTKLNALNGTVDVDTTPGAGTTVTIKLPLTLAIINALLVRIGKGVYAIPIDALAEIITVQKEKFQIMQRRRVVRMRDHVVPVVLFEEIFACSKPAFTTRNRNAAEETLCIIGMEQERVALCVDQLIGQEDIVIKSLAENFQNVRGFAGASIMGDGRVSLIFDVAGMLELAREARPGAACAVSEGIVAS